MTPGLLFLVKRPQTYCSCIIRQNIYDCQQITKIALKFSIFHPHEDDCIIMFRTEHDQYCCESRVRPRDKYMESSRLQMAMLTTLNVEPVYHNNDEELEMYEIKLGGNVILPTTCNKYQPAYWITHY